VKKIIYVILVLAAIGAVGGLNYHFIYTGNDFKILKKVELTFKDTFIDARGVKRSLLFLKPNLVKAGIKDLLGD